MNHFVIDGAIALCSDSMLDPNAIAQTYLNIIRQPRNACPVEAESLGERFPMRRFRRESSLRKARASPKLSKRVELRPWVERF